MLESDESINSSNESSRFHDDLAFLQDKEMTSIEESQQKVGFSCSIVQQSEDEEYYKLLSQFTELDLNVLKK